MKVLFEACMERRLINETAGGDVNVMVRLRRTTKGELSYLKRRLLHDILRNRLEIYKLATSVMAELGLSENWATVGATDAHPAPDLIAFRNASQEIHRYYYKEPGGVSEWRQMGWRLARACVNGAVMAESFDLVMREVSKK